MAILSTVSGFTNIGHDLQLTLTGNDGVAFTIPNLMSFEWREMTVDLRHMRMNGTTLVADLPRYWEGTIEFHRADSNVEQGFSTIQQQWLTGQDLQLGTMVCRVTGSGGGSFTFTDVSVRLEDGGRWRGDEVTICRIAFCAAKMEVGG